MEKKVKMWQCVIGGAKIFGVIVGLFSAYNGRATRDSTMIEILKTS